LTEIVTTEITFLKIFTSSYEGGVACHLLGRHFYPESTNSQFYYHIILVYHNIGPPDQHWALVRLPHSKSFASHDLSNNTPYSFPSSFIVVHTHTHTMRVQKARDLTIYTMLRHYHCYHYYNNITLCVSYYFWSSAAKTEKRYCCAVYKIIHTHYYVYIIVILTLYILCNLCGPDIMILWSCACVCVCDDFNKICWKQFIISFSLGIRVKSTAAHRRLIRIIICDIIVDRDDGVSHIF